MPDDELTELSQEIQRLVPQVGFVAADSLLANVVQTQAMYEAFGCPVTPLEAGLRLMRVMGQLVLEPLPEFVERDAPWR